MSQPDNHTPGPWFRSGCRQKVGGADTHSVVATIDGKEIIIASVWYNPITHEGFHDAGLIAAAPEMLSALQMIVSARPGWRSAAEAALAAVNKALGKSAPV